LSAIEILDELGPFGAAHPRPKFHTKFNHSNYFMRQFGRDNKHLAFKLEETSSDGYPLELIWFNHDFPESAEPENYDFVGSLDYNEFRGQKTLQFIIKHAIKR
jgi:single-stranded DNA-specific DHH superfamily exonuclease